MYPHMKWRWNRTMLNLCGIVAAILKMATGRNFSMSGMNSRHHYLPTYQIASQFDMWVDNDVPKQFLLVAIFKMATTIPQKFNIFRYHHNLICGYIMMSRIDSRHWTISTGRHWQCWIFAVLLWPFWKWRPVEIVQCRESIRDIIIYPHIKLSPFSKWPPQYRKKSTLYDIITIWYVGR
jgi:hypothetical protein